MSQSQYPERMPANFVPIEQLRRRTNSKSGDIEEPDAGVVEEQLRRFKEHLSLDEQAALESILGTRNTALTALGAVSPDEILNAEERKVVDRLLAAPLSSQRTLPAQVTLIMKATRYCNLRCTYCSSWSDKPNQTMSFEVLAHSIHGVLSAPGVNTAGFIWHGGEPTLLPIAFYRKALWLQERFRRAGQTTSNSIQTNGTRLNEQWLTFLKRYGFSVGISLDGPPEIHDSRRVDVAQRPTSERVQAGLRELQTHDIRHGVLMVVDEEVVRLGARRMLEFLLGLGVSRVSLLNVTPEGDPAEAADDEPYLTYGQFVEYLRELFEIWYPTYCNRISIREFNDLLGRLGGKGGSYCVYGPNCVGRFFTIEASGDVAHCDKYQRNPAFWFGNIVDSPLTDIPAAPALLRAHGYTAAGMDLARGCPWFDVCHGGCPYDRYVRVIRQNAAYDERCCGLAPLLTDMAEATGHGSRGNQEAVVNA